MPYTLSIVGVLVLLFNGCAGDQKINQFETGEQLYATYCASCHEIEGGIGPLLTKKVLATRVNAQYLFNYNKANMPYEAGNTLQDDQYWAITAYLLIREGFMPPSTSLNALNADTLGLEVRSQESGVRGQ